MKKYETLIEAFCESTYQNQFSIGIINKHSTKVINSLSFYENVKKILYSLQVRGISKEEKIIFQIDQIEEYISLFWSCILGGIVPVLVPAITTEKDKETLYTIWKELSNCYVVVDSSMKKTFCDCVFDKDDKKNTNKVIEISELCESKFEGEIVNVRKSDTVLIQYSSGTTGNPKGVVITHENLLSDIYGVISCQDISSKDILLSWLPLTHNLGLIVMHILPVIMGCIHYIMPKEIFICNPSKYLDYVQQYKVTISACPNFGLKHIVEYKRKNGRVHNIDTLRIIWNGAEPINPNVCDIFCTEMEKYGFRGRIVAGYGLAEATVVVTVMNSLVPHSYVFIDRNDIYIGNTIVVNKSTENAAAFVELGSPIDGCHLRICDDDNNDLGKFKIGNIQIKGKNIMSGYYQDKKATEESFTEDGWLNTGDIGFLHENNLVITGRSKEMIIVNGKNYFFSDIEQACIKANPTFLGDVYVCGLAINQGIESLAIIFVYTEEVDNTEKIVESTKRYLYENGISNVEYFFSADNVPKTVSGKVKRNILKSKAEKHIHNVSDKIEKSLLEIYYEVTQREIEFDVPIMEENLSSLEIFSIIAFIEEELQIQINPIDFYKFVSFREIAEHIKKTKLMFSKLEF